MSGVKPSRIELEAAEWVVLFDGADWDERDVRAFRRWLARSDAHRETFAATSKTWTRLDLLAELENHPLAANDVEDESLLDRRGLLLALGSSVVGGGLIGYVALSSNAVAFETRTGEQSQVSLADGSSINLNAATRVEAKVNDDHRRARVLSGEALFVISDGGDRAFVIATPFGEIETAAGEILVKVLPDRARVTLLSGSVLATHSRLFSAPRRVAADAHTELVLTDTIQSAPLPADTVARRTLWREGRLAFDDVALAEAAADVTRQTGVRFEFADPALAELRVGGLVDANDIDAFLLLLQENLDLTVTRREYAVVLSAATAP